MRSNFTRRLAITLSLLAMPLAALSSQQRPPDRESLVRQIEQRFMALAREQMALDQAQEVQLQEVVGRYARLRRDIERDEAAIKRGLQQQLRPGVAADSDSLTVLLERLPDVRESWVKTFRDEQNELAGFLDPVQQAQFVMLRERLLDQIRRIQAQRRP